MRSLRMLILLTGVVSTFAGPEAFATCGNAGGFAILQCSERAWFEPRPPASGAARAVFWQIGYGNARLDTGEPQGSTGTGMSDPTTFNGNDSGRFVVDLTDARSVLLDSRVPAGALCLNSNNWGSFGIDGCCDNVRDPNQTCADDDLLNPIFWPCYYTYETYGPTYNWVQDYPIAALVTESTGRFFALAAVATSPRSGVFDTRPGDYNFGLVSNGRANPLYSSATNVIPWQRVPGCPDPSDPNQRFLLRYSVDPAGGERTLDLSWIAAVVYSDGSRRPSTNPTVHNPGNGVGIADLGDLVRYVVDSQIPADLSDPLGSLDPGAWVPEVTTTATAEQVTLQRDACVRLRTVFGRIPQNVDLTLENCRLGRCGDIGYEVEGDPACDGISTDGLPMDLRAERAPGVVRLSWRTAVELSVSRFDVFAVRAGTRRLTAEVACQSCITGGGGSYSISIPYSQLLGAMILEVVAVGPGTRATVSLR